MLEALAEEIETLGLRPGSVNQGPALETGGRAVLGRLETRNLGLSPSHRLSPSQRSNSSQRPNASHGDAMERRILNQLDSSIAHVNASVQQHLSDMDAKLERLLQAVSSEQRTAGTERAPASNSQLGVFSSLSA